MKLLLYVLVAVSLTRAKSLNNLSNQRPNIWASTALDYLRNLTCDHSFFSVLPQCQLMKRTTADRIVVYAAERSKHTKLITILADGSRLSVAGEHDGVLVLDAFPEASFGHLLLVFVVDHKPKFQCDNGIFIENQNDCLRMALKEGCRSSMRRRRFHNNRRNHRCEIDILPSVYETTNSLESDVEVSYGPKLRCRSVPGFAHCPEPLPAEPVARVCDEDVDDEDCYKKLSNQLSIRCRLFETCDHAVILQGGWNSVTAKQADLRQLQETRTMLAFNGFTDENVKTFYADGNVYLPGISINNLYPASAKQLLRSHLRNLCHQSHCVDTLAVFIKGPALHDGSLLLWDIDNSGVANEGEIYTTAELYEDLSKCLAKQVYIVADYSYSGRLVAAFRDGPHRPKNVVVVSSGDEHQFSTDGQLTKLWFKQNRRSTCFRDIVDMAPETEPFSTPELYDERGADIADTTLSGAPCNVVPPFSDDELKEKYFGCQNVPSVQWFRRMATAAPPPIRGGKNCEISGNESNVGGRSRNFLSSNSTDTNLTKRKLSPH